MDPTTTAGPSQPSTAISTTPTAGAPATEPAASAPAGLTLAAIEPWTAELTGPAALVQVGAYAAHLAALQRTVLAAAEQWLDDGAVRARELRRCGRELMTVLYWLDRHLTGDARAAHWPGDHLAREVQAAVADYTRREQALFDDLAGSLGKTAMIRLMRSYHRAAQLAPTRPHPHLRYHGRLGGLALRLAGFIDDVRDGTDNRPAGPAVWARADQALRELETMVVTEYRERAVVSAMPVATPVLAHS